MIVEIQIEKPIVVDTTRQDLTVTEQIRLSLIRAHATRRELSPGLHKIQPTRRLIPQIYGGISGWSVLVINTDKGELHTRYRAMGGARGAVIPEPTVVELKPGEYHAVGDTDLCGRIQTNRVVANIPKASPGVFPDASPEMEPIAIA